MAMAALPLALLVAASGLARVRAQGEIRWAGDLQGGEPYVFRDPRDPAKLVGFEVEIARGLAARLDVRDRFVQNDWSNLVPSLERGDFDLILNGLEDTPAVRGRILLSRPHLELADPDVARGTYVIGLRKTDADLRDAIDAGLLDMESSGELRQIFTRWHLPVVPATAAPSGEAAEPPSASFDLAQVLL